MSLTQFKRSAYLWLAAAALVFVALTPIFNQTQAVLMSNASSGAARSHSDSGDQTASPNPSSGFDQEEKVRQLLAKQYEQRYGASDEAIRAALNIKGQAADFVGYSARQNRWLIAESKGSDLEKAFTQLANTTRGLLDKHPRVHLELRVYVKAEHYEFLRNGGNFGGYYMNSQGYMGSFNDLYKWEYAVVEGVKILLQVAP